MSTIVIQSVIGAAPVVSGTEEAVTGISAGSDTITCDGFTGFRVSIKRNGSRVPRIDAGEGFYSKDETENFITLSSALAEGEFIYIETIPQ